MATLIIQLERRNKRTGKTEKVRVWKITDRMVCTWLCEAVAVADGGTFFVLVTRIHSATPMPSHAIHRDSAEDVTEPDRAQICQFDENVWPRCGARHWV